MDDDGPAEEFPGLFEEIGQTRIDVDRLAIGTNEFGFIKMLGEVAHAYSIRGTFSVRTAKPGERDG